MASFFERPILNSPYEVPRLHHALDAEGQPLDLEPVAGRRRSEFITPVPRPRKPKGKAKQEILVLGEESSAEQEYNPTPIINEIRGHVAAWRELPASTGWGVTPATARLLAHWRHHEFGDRQPFFCQVEAVETIIWLTEVARRERRFAPIREHIRASNAQANPELVRLAMKMATGSGKTTVMAMLIAWQTVNAVRHPDGRLFSRGFLIVTPGITIRDRLRVLLPEDPDNYYRTRELLPADMLGEIGKAKIIITNYHAFQRRETWPVSKVGRALLQGRDEPLQTIETEGQMLQRACGELLALKNVVVLNDEAHHCYREKVRADDEDLTGEEKKEAEENSKAARLWISGLEALQRKVGLGAVYDLSATPFFLRGSGYLEGTLFPWVVSDFSLMDAIESGIVKLPRLPVSDNIPAHDMPMYRNLWEHIGKEMPKKGAGKSGALNPFKLPSKLCTALYALYGHYAETFKVWGDEGIEVPPVFIVVCNNTASSKLVYEWISGFDRPNDDGELINRHQGHLELFRNYDEYGSRLARPNTLLIDSVQLESGEGLDDSFREMAGAEIEQFKRELAQREGADAARKITDQDLLREVMNTVGRKGRLGEGIRCVVSVSMLTEGWDTNTVTHILGVRAFGTQLLCEQVMGRALRRLSYDLDGEGLFRVEYADILGVPFDFAAEAVKAEVTKPKPTTRVHALKEREALEITFPRVEGYRVDLPDERLTATFDENSHYALTPEEVGPCTVRLEGIVGKGHDIRPDVLDDMRPTSITYHLAKHLMYKHFSDADREPAVHLFSQIKAVCRRWLEEGYLVCKGGTKPGMLTYLEIAGQAAERIYLACNRDKGGEQSIKAILDPYNPKGSSRFVAFNTSKDTWKTAPHRCHVSHVVLDSDWEAELARVLESHPRVIAYVKNQGMQFEVPYNDGATPRRYVPDFIVRLDDGSADGLNLVLETKGWRKGDAQLKASTMRNRWVPGVNNLGTFGRWAFAEFTDVWEIEAGFARLVDGLVKGREKMEALV